MSATEKFFKTVKDVALLTNDIERLAQDSKEMREQLTHLDRRMVRLETIVELTQAQGSTKKLPKD